ncbi:MAG: PQQ-binding-like beta-propeller repeat protein [Nanoarchaeota archaeon]|nr:PQQ-binding-like beta-propeller repeat protein [Nanoarchaeota archaeon]
MNKPNKIFLLSILLIFVLSTGVLAAKLIRDPDNEARYSLYFGWDGSGSTRFFEYPTIVYDAGDVCGDVEISIDKISYACGNDVPPYPIGDTYPAIKIYDQGDNFEVDNCGSKTCEEASLVVTGGLNNIGKNQVSSDAPKRNMKISFDRSLISSPMTYNFHSTFLYWLAYTIYQGDSACQSSGYCTKVPGSIEGTDWLDDSFKVTNTGSEAYGYTEMMLYRGDESSYVPFEDPSARYNSRGWRSNACYDNHLCQWNPTVSCSGNNCPAISPMLDAMIKAGAVWMDNPEGESGSITVHPEGLGDVNINTVSDTLMPGDYFDVVLSDLSCCGDKARDETRVIITLVDGNQNQIAVLVDEVIGDYNFVGDYLFESLQIPANLGNELYFLIVDAGEAASCKGSAKLTVIPPEMPPEVCDQVDNDGDCLLCIGYPYDARCTGANQCVNGGCRNICTEIDANLECVAYKACSISTETTDCMVDPDSNNNGINCDCENTNSESCDTNVDEGFIYEDVEKVAVNPPAPSEISGPDIPASEKCSTQEECNALFGTCESASSSKPNAGSNNGWADFDVSTYSSNDPRIVHAWWYSDSYTDDLNILDLIDSTALSKLEVDITHEEYDAAAEIWLQVIPGSVDTLNDVHEKAVRVEGCSWESLTQGPIESDTCNLLPYINSVGDINDIGGVHLIILTWNAGSCHEFIGCMKLSLEYTSCLGSVCQWCGDGIVNGEEGCDYNAPYPGNKCKVGDQEYDCGTDCQCDSNPPSFYCGDGVYDSANEVCEYNLCEPIACYSSEDEMENRAACFDCNENLGMCWDPNVNECKYLYEWIGPIGYDCATPEGLPGECGSDCRCMAEDECFYCGDGIYQPEYDGTCDYACTASSCIDGGYETGCRDTATYGETYDCTFCGDGILQESLEECDFAIECVGDCDITDSSTWPDGFSPDCGNDCVIMKECYCDQTCYTSSNEGNFCWWGSSMCYGGPDICPEPNYACPDTTVITGSDESMPTTGQIDYHPLRADEIPDDCDGASFIEVDTDDGNDHTIQLNWYMADLINPPNIGDGLYRLYIDGEYILHETDVEMIELSKDCGISWVPICVGSACDNMKEQIVPFDIDLMPYYYSVNDVECISLRFTFDKYATTVAQVQCDDEFIKSGVCAKAFVEYVNCIPPKVDSYSEIFCVELTVAGVECVIDDDECSPEKTDWSMWQHDSNLKGYNSYVGMSSLTSLPIWSEFVYNDLFTSPIVYSDTVFTLAYNGELKAWNKQTGNMKWVEQVSSESEGILTPAASENLVYAVVGNTIKAYYVEDGTLIWETTVDRGDDSKQGVTTGGLLVAKDKLLVSSNSGDGLIVFNKYTGALMFRLGGATTSVPAYDLGSNLIINTAGETLIQAVTPERERVKWSLDTNILQTSEDYSMTPVIEDGRIYYPVYNGGGLLVLDTAGKILSYPKNTGKSNGMALAKKDDDLFYLEREAVQAGEPEWKGILVLNKVRIEDYEQDNNGGWPIKNNIDDTTTRGVCAEGELFTGVSIDLLRSSVAGCDSISKWRERECAKAASQYCQNIGYGAGIVTGTGSSTMDVYCVDGEPQVFRISDLKQYNPGCKFTSDATQVSCLSAYRSYCRTIGLNAGLPVDWDGEETITVVCTNAKYEDISSSACNDVNSESCFDFVMNECAQVNGPTIFGAVSDWKTPLLDPATDQDYFENIGTGTDPVYEYRGSVVASYPVLSDNLLFITIFMEDVAGKLLGFDQATGARVYEYSFYPKTSAISSELYDNVPAIDGAGNVYLFGDYGKLYAFAPVNPQSLCEEEELYVIACNSDADCSDEDPCNGVETCINNECVAGTPIDCTAATCEDCDMDDDMVVETVDLNEIATAISSQSTDLDRFDMNGDGYLTQDDWDHCNSFFGQTCT